MCIWPPSGRVAVCIDLAVRVVSQTRKPPHETGTVTVHIQHRDSRPPLRQPYLTLVRHKDPLLFVAGRKVWAATACRLQMQRLQEVAGFPLNGVPGGNAFQPGRGSKGPFSAAPHANESSNELINGWWHRSEWQDTFGQGRSPSPSSPPRPSPRRD